jgi:hypothetical protein
VLTKKGFDAVLAIVLLSKPAVGIVKMAARRWSKESDGAMGTVGDAVQVAL